MSDMDGYKVEEMCVLQDIEVIMEVMRFCSEL